MLAKSRGTATKTIRFFRNRFCNIMHLSRITTLLADVSATLIGNGAGSNRTKRNVSRIAAALNCDAEFFFSFSAVIVTVRDKATSDKVTVVKSIGGHHVNFSIVSDISILSWDIAQKKLPVDIGVLERELENIRKTKTYPAWIVYAFIGLATSSLCMIFGGDWPQFGIAYLAAITGLWFRRFLVGKHYNVYMNWMISAFVSVSVVNLFRISGFDSVKEALTVCVLWLIPGVPLINGFMDILEGHLVSGWAKFFHGILLVFMIAIGFYLSLFLFGFNV